MPARPDPGVDKLEFIPIIFQTLNKIMLRFYETRLCRSTGEKFIRQRAKIPIPVAPICGIFATLRQASGNSNLNKDI